jgi:hypothetical protein
MIYGSVCRAPLLGVAKQSRDREACWLERGLLTAGLAGEAAMADERRSFTISGLLRTARNDG